MNQCRVSIDVKVVVSEFPLFGFGLPSVMGPSPAVCSALSAPIACFGTYRHFPMHPRFPLILFLFFVFVFLFFSTQQGPRTRKTRALLSSSAQLTNASLISMHLSDQYASDQ